MGGKWTFSRIFEVVFQSLASVFEIESAGDAVADRQQAAATAWLPRAVADLTPLPGVLRLKPCPSTPPCSLSFTLPASSSFLRSPKAPQQLRLCSAVLAPARRGTVASQLLPIAPP